MVTLVRSNEWRSTESSDYGRRDETDCNWRYGPYSELACSRRVVLIRAAFLNEIVVLSTVSFLTREQTPTREGLASLMRVQLQNQMPE